MPATTAPRRALAAPSLAPALTLVLALLLGAPHAAQARQDPICPAKRGTLAKTGMGRVWHAGSSLYACTTVYGRPPRTRRLGPWKPGAKVAWDGARATWSVPLVRAGVRSDRLYAGSAEDGRRWLLGVRAVPATAAAPAAEARVQRVFAWGSTAGWVTQGGQVVFAVQDPQEDPKPVGTPPTAPVADQHLTLVGAWPDIDPAALAATVRIDAIDGDGDECGGSQGYRLTVVPDPSTGARVGVVWWASWERPYCG